MTCIQDERVELYSKDWKTLFWYKRKKSCLISLCVLEFYWLGGFVYIWHFRSNIGVSFSKFQSPSQYFRKLKFLLSIFWARRSCWSQSNDANLRQVGVKIRIKWRVRCCLLNFISFPLMPRLTSSSRGQQFRRA